MTEQFLDPVFYVDVPPLNVQQRLDLKALFQKIGITTQNGKESEAAAQFLQKLGFPSCLR